MTYNNKAAELRRRLRELESAVVAFSGGVDSALLTFLAHQELGGKMCAATSVSPSIPALDRECADNFCRTHNIPHIEVKTNELEDENYAKNPLDRCYYCKSALFERLTQLAAEKKFRYVIEGTNYSDLSGHRPGFKAALNEPNVITPLIEAQMSKDDVRRMARDLALDIAEKPSSACLASRVPQGVTLTETLLKQIDAAEQAIRSHGINQVRLRHHGDLARIEITKDDFAACIEHRDEIVRGLNRLGYKFVTLDLLGYRTGGTTN